MANRRNGITRYGYCASNTSITKQLSRLAVLVTPPKYTGIKAQRALRVERSLCIPKPYTTICRLHGDGLSEAPGHAVVSDQVFQGLPLLNHFRLPRIHQHHRRSGKAVVI